MNTKRMCQTLIIFWPRGGAGQGLEGRRDVHLCHRHRTSCWLAPAKAGAIMFFYEFSRRPPHQATARSEVNYFSDYGRKESCIDLLGVSIGPWARKT